MATEGKGVVLKGRFTIRSDEPNEHPMLHQFHTHKPATEASFEESKPPLLSQRTLERPIHEVEPHPIRVLSPVTPSKPPLPHPPTPHSPPSTSQMVPFDVFQSVTTVISSKFSEMLSLHRDIMLEIIQKDKNRDELALLLCRENAKLLKEAVELEGENQFNRER